MRRSSGRGKFAKPAEGPQPVALRHQWPLASSGVFRGATVERPQSPARSLGQNSGAPLLARKLCSRPLTVPTTRAELNTQCNPRAAVVAASCRSTLALCPRTPILLPTAPSSSAQSARCKRSACSAAAASKSMMCWSRSSATTFCPQTLAWDRRVPADGFILGSPLDCSMLQSRTPNSMSSAVRCSAIPRRAAVTPTAVCRTRGATAPFMSHLRARCRKCRLHRL
jgi:hypothetical protein